MRTYDLNFKQEAVKLASEIGCTKTARELNIPVTTLETWRSKSKTGSLTGKAVTLPTALSQAEEIKQLKQENKELKRVNEILRKATAFFAQSQKM